MTNDQRPGFTLLELIVSMSIFTVITGFVLINFRAGQRSDEIRFAADGAASVIRDALSRATAGATVEACVSGSVVTGICGSGAVCGGVCSTRVPKGWGVAFGTAAPNDGITLFVDLDGNKLYDANETVLVEPYSSSGFVTATAASPTPLRTTVLFVPPLPDALVDGAAAATEATLTLTHGAGGAVRTVHFNRVSRLVTVTNP